MRRMTITLHQDEHEALITLAERKRREPRQHAAMIIRHELERLGLLPPADIGDAAQAQAQKHKQQA